MDIIVHGTKGGSKIFTTKKISGLLDVSSDTSKATAIGQQAYGIRFTSDNTIFSKYKIIRDVRGDKRTGFVCFSLPIPNNKKLSGVDIITVLDKVSEEYCQEYIVDNNLNEVTEDWNFLDRILGEYNTKLRNISHEDVENMQSGDKDDTFIYFKDNSELQKYFEDPFHEEYAPYRQVLFIINDLQDKPENPLNAMRHSENDLTGKIDLENPLYKLREFHGIGKNGVEIKIKNSRGRELHNKDKIYRNEELTVVYSKKYYHEKRIGGSLLNNEELRKCLVVSSDNSIGVVKEIELQPETKTVTFDVVTKKDRAKITDAEIQVNTQPWQYLSNVTFTAEELGREHKIAARKGDNLFSAVEKIIPKDYSAASLTLPLIENKIVKIIATEAEGEKNYISDFKVWISDEKGRRDPKVGEITFVDDQIDKIWYINIVKDGYMSSERISYCPRIDDSTIHFELKKAIKASTTNSNEQNEQPTHLKEYEKQKSIAGKLKPIISSPITIIITIAFVASAAFLAWNPFSDKENQPKEPLISAQDIKDYVEGDSLFLNTLKEYQKNWKSLEQNFIIKSGGGFFGGKEKSDSAKWKSEWKPIDESIDKAIEKRELIKSKNFEKLRSQHYFDKQLSFKTAIEIIDPIQYEEVSDKLGDVSNLTLTQINNSIHQILNPEESAVEEETLQERNRGKDEPEHQKETPEKKEQPIKQTDQEEQKTAEIIQYIRGSELDEEKLKGYKNTKGISQELKKSIQLCLDFWELDGSTNGKKSKTYWTFREEVNAADNFNNSKLKAFLEKMHQKANPSYSKQDKKKGLK